MTRPRVALRVPVGRPLPELAAFAARCEQAGFDGVGIHDHPSSGRDAYLALAMAARATHRLQLFPATSSPLVRHPLVLASLAHSLEEIAPGRTYLTVAPGFISTRSVGKPRATVAFMRAAIRDRSAFGRRSRRAASSGGRCQAGRPLPGRLPGGFRSHARSRIRCRGGDAMGAELVRSRSALPRLSERLESSLARGRRLRARGRARSRRHPRGSGAPNCRCIWIVRPAGTLCRATPAGAGGRRG